MSKTKNWISIALVALFTTSTVLFAAPAAGSAEPTYLLVLDTPEGIVEKVMTQGEVDAMDTCAIDSPVVADCTNGPRVRVSAAGHGILLPLPSGFTANGAATVPVHKMIFTSYLTTASTSRLFRCEINETPAPAGTGAVTFACFPGSGTFPAVGASMSQHAIALASTQGPGAQDTTTLQIYNDHGVIVPGLGRVTAQLTY